MRVVLYVLMALVCAGCQSPKGPDTGVDLIPVKPTNISGAVGWCKMVDGKLQVTVRCNTSVARGEMLRASRCIPN